MAAVETYWRHRKILVCWTCTSHLHMDRVERVWPVIVGLCCSAVPVHSSRELLLWSFKAKREYSGVQRQHNTTSTQGQTPIFTVSMAFIVAWPRSSDELDKSHTFRLRTTRQRSVGRDSAEKIWLIEEWHFFFKIQTSEAFPHYSCVKMNCSASSSTLSRCCAHCWVLNLLEKLHQTAKALPGCHYGQQNSSQKKKYRRLNPHYCAKNVRNQIILIEKRYECLILAIRVSAVEPEPGSVVCHLQQHTVAAGTK